MKRIRLVNSPFVITDKIIVSTNTHCLLKQHNIYMLFYFEKTITNIFGLITVNPLVVWSVLTLLTCGLKRVTLLTWGLKR